MSKKKPNQVLMMNRGFSAIRNCSNSCDIYYGDRVVMTYYKDSGDLSSEDIRFVANVVGTLNNHFREFPEGESE